MSVYVCLSTCLCVYVSVRVRARVRVFVYCVCVCERELCMCVRLCACIYDTDPISTTSSTRGAPSGQGFRRPGDVYRYKYI